MATTTKTIKIHRCEHCEHEWQARRKRKPRMCPVCKRRNWDISPKTESANALRGAVGGV